VRSATSLQLHLCDHGIGAFSRSCASKARAAAPFWEREKERYRDRVVHRCTFLLLGTLALLSAVISFSRAWVLSCFASLAWKRVLGWLRKGDLRQRGCRFEPRFVSSSLLVSSVNDVSISGSCSNAKSESQIGDELARRILSRISRARWLFYSVALCCSENWYALWGLIFQFSDTARRDDTTLLPFPRNDQIAATATNTRGNLCEFLRRPFARLINRYVRPARFILSHCRAWHARYRLYLFIPAFAIAPIICFVSSSSIACAFRRESLSSRRRGGARFDVSRVNHGEYDRAYLLSGVSRVPLNPWHARRGFERSKANRALAAALPARDRSNSALSFVYKFWGSRWGRRSRLLFDSVTELTVSKFPYREGKRNLHVGGNQMESKLRREKTQLRAFCESINNSRRVTFFR